MKKVLCVLVLVLVIVAIVGFLPTKSLNNEYLRIHIRANSNSEIDQNVKYEVKDLMVEYLTPKLSEISSKDDAIQVITKENDSLKAIAEAHLNSQGFNYSVNIKIDNEYFPTRSYGDTTLESGYYDAVIVELGEAKGDNWWCIMYPPLCFTSNKGTSTSISYKSKIVEWINKLVKE